MKFLRNTVVVSILTFISRCFGYLRDVIIAAVIGTGPLNDALIAAWRFANLFRSVFAEGALNASFVPVFSQTLAKGSRSYPKKIASYVQSLLLITLLLFSAIVICAMPEVMKFVTPGFTEHSKFFYTAVELARITFPYLIFISLAAFYGGVLSTIDKLAPFASTTILFNISIILFALYFDSSINKAYSVAYGIAFAGVLELVWMLAFAKKYNFLIPICMPKISPEVKTIAKRMGAGIIGSGIYHIGIWIDMAIASFVSGGMSYLYYADRIVQMPLAIIATSASTALLPALSKVTRKQNEANSLTDSSIKVTMYFLIPVSISFAYFAHEIIEILFERGAFTNNSTQKTASAFAVLSFGLPAFAMAKLFSSTFHAKGDVSTPVKISAIALIINVIVSVSLLKKFEHVGVVVGSVSAAWISVISLLIILIRKKYYKIQISTAFYLGIYSVSSIISLLMMSQIHHLLFQNKILDFISVILLGASLYIYICNYSLKFLQKQVL